MHPQTAGRNPDFMLMPGQSWRADLHCGCTVFDANGAGQPVEHSQADVLRLRLELRCEHAR